MTVRPARKVGSSRAPGDFDRHSDGFDPIGEWVRSGAKSGFVPILDCAGSSAPGWFRSRSISRHPRMIDPSLDIRLDRAGSDEIRTAIISRIYSPESSRFNHIFSRDLAALVRVAHVPSPSTLDSRMEVPLVPMLPTNCMGEANSCRRNTLTLVPTVLRGNAVLDAPRRRGCPGRLGGHSPRTRVSGPLRLAGMAAERPGRHSHGGPWDRALPSTYGGNAIDCLRGNERQRSWSESRPHRGEGGSVGIHPVGEN
jgi:hypothetical protein